MKQAQLTVGDLAPQFTTFDSFGKKVDLSEYKDKFVLLVFLRYSGCPLCNLTIHRLALENSMLTRSGCQVLAFVQSDADHIKSNIYDRHEPKPPFPIIADAGRKFYDRYGVQVSTVKAGVKLIKDVPYWLKSVYKLGYKQTEIDGELLLVPAAFLIGPHDQRIVRAEYGSSFYDHTMFTDVYESLTFDRDS